MAIIMSQAQQQNMNRQKKQAKKASGTELRQIDKVNKLFLTSSEDRLVDKRK